MIDILNRLGEGDLIVASSLSSPKTIMGCYSSQKEWVVLLKDNHLTFIYNVLNNKWYYRTIDSTNLKEISSVIFYKRMDSVTVRDMKLGQILEL